MYAPLYCKSNFSFLEGASHPEELVETASQLGLKALALTDRDGLYGMVRAHMRARELGLPLLVGSELTIDDGSTLILLARDRAGYANLCGLITRGRRRCIKGESRVAWSEVAEHAAGLIALWGGDRAAIHAVREPERESRLLREAFGERLYALITRHRRATDVESEARLRRRVARWGVNRAAAVEVLYHTPGRRALQDVLSCVRHGVALRTAGHKIKPNGEHDLKAPFAFGTLFQDDRAAVEATIEIAEQCRFEMGQLRYVYPLEKIPAGETSSSWLRALTFSGAHERYGASIPAAVARQLDKELTLIEELDYGGYFLTMWEIVRYCREHGILCQGRGSAANSAVCYCLGVTAIDPVRIDLLFERFLSKERAEPPDIDLDIEHERREEVIQHVYDKYGRDHAAMVANVIRYRPRSAVRDVGKALGLAEVSLDRLAKLLSHYGEVQATSLSQAGLDPDSPVHQQLLALSNELLDFPRHLSIHPGGFLIGHEPVHRLVPIENGAMERRTVIQWDKTDVEDLGLFKVDLLGLGALHQVHLCLDMLRRQYGRELSMATIPAEDPETYAMIGDADTVGVFQIESRAQMSMLPRLRPKTFYDLVIEVSIVRPGPISGGMVHPFLRRRHGEEPVQYPHPSLEPVLAKTLGVPLFQEQVMKLAVVAADYTPGEADQLRRDMAAWRRTGRIEKHHQRLVSRMRAKGIAAEFAERVFEQIRGFGEYGFPESHAASFALISYATSWLKRHYPAAFAASLLNAQPMGFYSPATIVEDAKHHGIEVRPVDVVRSDDDCTLEPRAAGEFALRLGLRYLRGLAQRDRALIVAARAAQPFSSLFDFVRRARLDLRRLSLLAEAGALESLGHDRRSALWELKSLVQRRDQELGLEPPPSEVEFAPLDLTETIAWDYDTMMLSTHGHPMQTLRPQLTALGLLDAEEVRATPHGRRVRYAGAVICRQRPGTAKGTVFLTLEDESGFVNVVIWPKVWQKSAFTIKTNALLGIRGKVETQHGVTHLIADEVFVPRIEGTSVESPSRDFH